MRAIVHATTKAKPRAQVSVKGQLENPKPGRALLISWLCATSPNLIVVTVTESGNLVAVTVVPPGGLVVRLVLICVGALVMSRDGMLIVGAVCIDSDVPVLLGRLDCRPGAARYTSTHP